MELGDRIGKRFELEGIAGAGAMARVYRARDLTDGSTVAVKVLRNFGADAEARFRREAAVLAELRHPHIVRYIDHGTTPDGDHYLAMEWLEGETLRQRLSRVRLSVEGAIGVCRGAAEALSVAHRRGVVHRDIKPGNLFLPQRLIEHVKVLDFGVARLLFATASHTQTGVRIGTLRYMSPEQARGERDVDARADVFALGCVLYECLTERPAFPGVNDMAVLGKLVLEDPPHVRALNAQVPKKLGTLIARMLSKEPRHRPADATELLSELQPIRTQRIRPATLPDLGDGILSDAEKRLLCIVMAGPDQAGETPDGTIQLGGFGTRKRKIAIPRIEAFGGRVETLGDGALVVTLAGAGSASDLASRAARCALTIREISPHSNIALAMGWGQIEGQEPVGKVIDQAAALLREPEQPHHSGEYGRHVRIDDTAARLLDTHFELVDAKSRHFLVREREGLEAARTLLGKSTSFVGRRRELITLEALFCECVEDSVARTALVVGRAGAGKSRLRFEFLRRLANNEEDMQVWVARGDPMRAGSPLGLLADCFRRAAGVQEGAALSERRRRVRECVERHLEGPDAKRVATFLGEMVGVSFADQGVQLRAARQDIQLMGDQMRRAWEDWLAAELTAGPVILVIEDTHWSDRPSIELIDRALHNFADRPWMVMAMARPHIREVFPKLWHSRDVQEIRLAPLTKRASMALVREALGEHKADAMLVQRIVERAVGNAFHLEEMVRAIVEGSDKEFPDTVLAIAQARLERLEPDARQLLRAASVFGQVFWSGAVAALVGQNRDPKLVADWLDVLADREVISTRGTGRFPDQSEYRFRHDLIREGAYAMLTDENRRLGHRLAAKWLIEAGESDAVTIAEHFELGDNREEGVEWYRRAAEQALEGNALDAAVDLVRRGLACGADGRDRVALKLIEVEANSWRADNKETVRCAQEVIEQLAVGSPDWCTTVATLAVAGARLGDWQALITYAPQLTDLVTKSDATGPQVTAAARVAASLLYRRADLAEELATAVEAVRDTFADEPLVAARVYNLVAQRAFFVGDLAQSLYSFLSVARCYDRAGNLRLKAMHLANISAVYIELGAYGEAEATVRESLQLCERLGLPGVSWGGKLHLGVALTRRGVPGGRDYVRAAAEGFRAQGNRRMEGACRAALARAVAQFGDMEGAEREARSSLQLLSNIDSMHAYARAVMSQVLRLMGRAQEARTHVEVGIEILHRLGQIEEGEGLLRAENVALLVDAGHLEQARSALVQAKSWLQGRADKISDAQLREQMLFEVPENARIVKLAHQAGIDW